MQSIDDGGPLDAMCDDIVERYHAGLQRLLPRIRDELTAIATTAASMTPDLLRETFEDLADQIQSHLAKEETLLFPAIEALSDAEQRGTGRPTLPFATVLYPIRLMESEHVRIEDGVAKLRELARTVVEPDNLSLAWHQCMADLAELDAELREHHRTENEVLFPRALELERSLL